MDATPPSMAFAPRQTSLWATAGQWRSRAWAAAEGWLEEEREQIPLWAPVALGSGIAAWFLLLNARQWLAFACAMLGLACAALVVAAGGRARRIILAGAILACAGCLLVWGKASLFGTAPLSRPVFVEAKATVLSVQDVPAQHMVRVRVAPLDRPDLAPLVRLNVAAEDVPEGLGERAEVRFRARLMPPAPPTVPGGYDFAARAYFQGIGATGKALAPIVVVRPSAAEAPLRARLFAHVMKQATGPGAGIAAALATGDQGAIGEDDAEAMRRSGLAHLLSISGLHVTALIGAVMLIILKGLALSRRAALHLPLPLIAAAGGALAGIGYTLLTGAEVPTVRSCVAALLVLGGLAVGREALTLRLVATGALVVLALWPEALIGPSFQMSFAAVTALVALSEHPRFKAFAAARDEGRARKLLRALAVMVATGVAVELALTPIALFHFHKAGLLGAFANLIAIPLTTFIVMPAEAIALCFDVVGLGAPFWWIAGQALRLLLLLAHTVAASPAATMVAPVTSPAVFGMTMVGLLWCLLWRTRWRWLGAPVVVVGMIATLAAPPPDILVTGDGRHVAVRQGAGMALLRDRAGDFVRDALSESAGYAGEMSALSALPSARCSADLCALRMDSAGRSWRLLLTRSRMLVDRASFQRDCAAADIVISDRALPRWCAPRWLKVDRRLLTRTGGLSITFANGAVRTVRSAGDEHPWIARSSSARLRRHQL